MSLAVNYFHWLCQVLVCRNYRGDIDMSVIDKFMPLLMEREEEGQLVPIIQHAGVIFVYIKYNNLYRILFD
jgi:AP-1 complex subunit mu